MADIPNPIPQVIPAKAEKVLDKQFCTKLEITAHPNKPWSAKFVGMPYDGDLTLGTQPFMVELQDLKELAALDAELAQAMGGVLAVIGKYLVKCKIANKRIVNKDNIEEILS
jgi:hypothetical protein